MSAIGELNPTNVRVYKITITCPWSLTVHFTEDRILLIVTGIHLKSLIQSTCSKNKWRCDLLIRSHINLDFPKIPNLFPNAGKLFTSSKQDFLLAAGTILVRDLRCITPAATYLPLAAIGLSDVHFPHGSSVYSSESSRCITLITNECR